MKKLSLVTQSLITEFAYGLAFVLVGVVRMASDKGLTDFMPDWMVLIVRVLLVLLAAMPAIERLFFRKRFDVWDETAKVHRSEAREITFLLMQIAMLLVIAVLMSSGKLDSIMTIGAKTNKFK